MIDLPLSMTLNICLYTLFLWQYHAMYVFYNYWIVFIIIPDREVVYVDANVLIIMHIIEESRFYNNGGGLFAYWE